MQSEGRFKKNILDNFEARFIHSLLSTEHLFSEQQFFFNDQNVCYDDDDQSHLLLLMSLPMLEHE